MNSLVRTEQIWMNLDDVISSLCHFSKNLWNEANYAVRQEFINNHIWIRYNTLAGTFKTSENFKSIKEWSKHPEKFLGRPKLPNYKPKDEEALLVFTNQQVSIKDGYLLFPKNLQLQPIKTRLGDDSKLREVRIIPKGVGYAHQGVKVGSTMTILTEKRKCKIKDQMHKTSRCIIDYCIHYKISTIIIGHNDTWKQECDLGKRNNQNFISIPFEKLIHMLKYKAQEVGIRVMEQQESHTSKCSFLDNESIEHHEEYVGKRNRGLFYSFKGVC